MRTACGLSRVNGDAIMRDLSPAGATRAAKAFRAVSSAVEHYLDMVGVTGSKPVPPTNINNDLGQLLLALFVRATGGAARFGGQAFNPQDLVVSRC